MGGKLAAVAAVSTLALAGSVPAAALLPAQRSALHALAQAQAAGRVDSASAAVYRREITRAAALVRQLPPGRSLPVARCLGQAAALGTRLTAPRARAVFGQLAANDDWFARRGPPPAQTDISDADGVVYRYFASRCFEFHPLANFGALNADLAAGDTNAASRLAAALVARGVPQPHGGIGFEYYFDFGAGRAPWLSGMAQAVAAQALARASAGGDATLLAAARAAYAPIPGRLLTHVAAGPWIRLYAFSSLTVLNAQLQTVLSLKTYADAAGDTSAAALASRLQEAAATTLPRFDTGYWSDYSLDGDPAPLDYEQYVTQLLVQLSGADPRFAAAAARFRGYLKQPPAFRLSTAAVGATRFWLSKPATVSVQSPAGPGKSLSLGAGWHTVSWKLPGQAGIYPVSLSARDWAGNTASADALPLVRVSTTPAAGSSLHSGAAAGAAQPTAAPSFLAGAGVDVPEQGALAAALGLRGVRLGVAWPAGATTPDPALVAALLRVPAREGVVVELTASPLPADDAGRAALAAYAAALAEQVPSLTELVLAPAVSAPTAAAYVQALGAVSSQVHTAAPTLAVGALLDGAQTPKTVLAALAAAVAASNPAVTLDVLAFRPAPAAATGAWALGDLAKLQAAIVRGFAIPPPVLVDGVAMPTAVPPEKAAAYPTAPPAGGMAEADQAAAYAAVLAAASCDPGVAGVVFDRLVDSGSAGATTGLYYADGAAKASAAAVASAAVAAQRGQNVCPGLHAPAAASSLVLPVALPVSGSVAVQLGCTRDCLYLVTLERDDGTPVAARRGALPGGAAPRTIALPPAQLAPGTYHVAVRLLAQTNPGTTTLVTGDPMTTP